MAGKVTVGLAESNDNLPPGSWLCMLSPAGWLPRVRDQLQPPTFNTSMGSGYLYLLYLAWLKDSKKCRSVRIVVRDMMLDLCLHAGFSFCQLQVTVKHILRGNWKKLCHYTFVYNFDRWRLIIRVLSPMYSLRNCNKIHVTFPATP